MWASIVTAVGGDVELGRVKVCDTSRHTRDVLRDATPSASLRHVAARGALMDVTSCRCNFGDVVDEHIDEMGRQS